MKKRRILALLLAFILAADTLAGCGGNSGDASSSENGSSSSGKDNDSGKSTKSGAAKVSFWTLSTRQAAVDPIVEAFNKENPDVEVTVSYYDTDGIKDACKVAASSKTLPNMWFNWGGSLGSFYVENGLTYDLTEYAKEHNWSETFNQGALDLCTLQDELSGYPTSYNVLGIYYRKDIFEQYHLEVPSTFEEFEQVCATLKENGVTPISTAGLYGWHVMRFVELLIEHYAGAGLHDQMNKFEESYNNDAVIKALEKYQEFCEKGYFPEGFVTADPNDTNMALYSGTAAMDIQGQWYDGNILQNEQDINNYGVFPFPSGDKNRMSAFAEMTQFNKDNSEEELEACMRFMDYYYNEENSAAYAEYYNLPLPKNDAAMPEGQPNVPVMLETSSNNGTFTITDQAFPTEVADVLFDVQDALANGQTTPKEGAASIQAAIEAYQNK